VGNVQSKTPLHTSSLRNLRAPQTQTDRTPQRSSAIGKYNPQRSSSSTGFNRLNTPSRLPNQTASSPPRVKAPDPGLSNTRSGSRIGSGHSQSNRNPSSSLTYGHRGNRYAGSLTLDRHGDHRSLHGSLLYYGNRDKYRRGYPIYPRPYPYAATYPYRYPYAPSAYYRDCSLDSYYYGYRPIYSHYPRFYDPYYPLLGYSYVSLYYPEPVVYRQVEIHHTYSEAPEVYQESTVYQQHADDLTYNQAPIDSTVRPAPPVDQVGPMDQTAQAADLVEPEPAVNEEQLAIVGEGVVAFREGNYDEARNAFVRAVLADERDGYAKLLYGLTSFATGDYAVAAVSWRRALLTSDMLIDRPPDVRYLYEDEAAFRSQFDALTRIASERPDDRDVNFVLAYLLYATGEAERAATLFDRLAETDKADALSATLAETAKEKAAMIPRSE
jgi:thioredoxin-like negative regulator of GroEL